MPEEIRYQPIKDANELELYLSGDKIACLICGVERKSLGAHVSRTHSLSPKEYKEMFNIPVTRSLCGEDLRARKREITKKMWRESPKMEGVRQGLLENIDRLNGYKFRSKSSIPHQQSKKRGSELKKLETEACRAKYREIYLGHINDAIRRDVTLYAVFNHTDQIYRFAKRYPNDTEFSERLGLVRRPGQASPGEGLVERICEVCEIPYRARHNRKSRACSRDCAAKLKIVERLKKNCVACGKEILLTPTMYKRLSTCGSEECKKARRQKKPINPHQADRY
jgi:hypothetical protein